MPEVSTEGTGSASLEAKVIRADGTEEELGVIARTDPEPPDDDEED